MKSCLGSNFLHTYCKFKPARNIRRQQHKLTWAGSQTRHNQVKSTQIETCDCSPPCMMNNSFDIKTVGVMLCLNSNHFTVSFDMLWPESSLKSSAILHFRDFKFKNFPYKASHIQYSTQASKLQFQPLPPPVHTKKSFLWPDSFDIKTVGVN